MSHITRIKTQFTNQEILLKALDDLKYPAEVGDFTIQSTGKNESTQANIRVKRLFSADIGFHWNIDHYDITADWFMVMGITREKFYNQVSQRYAYHAAREKLEAQGFALVEENEENGKIRLVLRRAV